MSKKIVGMAAVILFTAAAAANAQTSGPAYDYCQKLIEIYDRFIGSDERGPRQGPSGTDLDGRVAVAKCRAGDTASGIPVLEQRLSANGFALPKR